MNVAPTPLAMTVLGPVDAGELGVTLTHEHVHMDATPLLAVHGYETADDRPFDLATAVEARWNPGIHADNYRLTDEDLVAEELLGFAAAGGRTIVDVTPVELGRSADALHKISMRTGLNVVMGTGHYTAAVDPPDLDQRGVDDLAGELIGEWLHGVTGSGIRPGIIGEIGTSAPVHPREARVLRAAARASRETGLAVTVHLQPWATAGERVLDILLGEGIAVDRIVLGHLSTAHDDHGYLERLAATGVYLSFDLFGFDHSLLGLGRYAPSDADVAGTVARLVIGGHGDRVLISQDVGVRSRLRRYGGWGYGHLLAHVVPLLRARGLDQSAVDHLLVANPRAVLTLGPSALAVQQAGVSG